MGKFYNNNNTIFLSPHDTPAPNKVKRLPGGQWSCYQKLIRISCLWCCSLTVTTWHAPWLIGQGPIYCYNCFDKRERYNLLSELAGEVMKKRLKGPTRQHRYTVQSKRTVRTVGGVSACIFGIACLRRQATTTQRLDSYAAAAIFCTLYWASATLSKTRIRQPSR